jgi:hypothetical protein
MHVAVLLLYLNDFPRRTTFSRDWAERALTVVGDYYAAQSAGAVHLTWQVFDWLEMEIDEPAWLALSSTGIDDVVKAVQPRLPAGTDLLGGFDHILVGIDSKSSSGGTTPGSFSYVGAVNFTPSTIAHEFGHRFGASDAFGSDGRRYLNHYCVMGSMGWPYTFDPESLVADEAAGLARTGPNMSAPTLMATGWLDPNRHDVYTDLTGSPEVTSGGAPVELAALAGGPGAGLSHRPVVVRYGTYLIEYRVPSGWDRGLRKPLYGAAGWLVVHESSLAGPVASFVADQSAYAGATLALGPDNPFDIESPGPLVIRVASVEPDGRALHLWLSRRPAQGRLGSWGVGIGGGDGGGWVWTPGRGLHRIPPYSPLLPVADLLAEVAALHDLADGARDEALDGVRERTAATLEALRDTVMRVPDVAPLSPMQQALTDLDTLEEVGNRLADQLGEGHPGQEYLQISRATIAQLRGVAETAARLEQRG